MAYVLRLSDGTTTVDFMEESGTSWCRLEDGGLFIGHPPEKSTWSGTRSATHGRRLSNKVYDNRTIKIRFEIGGTTKSNILDKQQTIHRLLENAVERQIYNTAYEVYLEYQVDTTSGSIKFTVVSGELAPPDDFMSLEKQTWEKAGGYTVKGWELTLVCNPFGYGAESQIVTSDTIRNIHDDTPYVNYVSWSGSSIKGDVDGPLRIRFKNLNAVQTNRLYSGLRDIGTPSNFLHVLEAVTPGVGDPYYGVYTTTHDQSGSDQSPAWYWSSPTTGSIISWSITPGSGIDFKGKVRVIAVTDYSISMSSNTYYLSVEQSDIGIVKETPYVTGGGANNNVMDLGVIDLDPSGTPPEYYGDDWTLRLKIADSSPNACSLRALLLFPAKDYKYRAYDLAPIAQNETLEDIARHEVVGVGTTTKRMSVEPKGFPIHAKPGSSARLYFTQQQQTNSDWSGSYQATIDVWHTPYYLYVRGSG